jgi:hypothetical protein
VSLEALQKTEVATTLGPLWLWARPGAFEATRPAILTVTGAFAGADVMSRLPELMGEACDCVLVHLPGNHSPLLRETSVAAFAQALGEAIEARLSHRPVVLCGLSIGALVVLATQAAAVRRIVAAEPLLATGKLWSMLPQVRNRVRAGDAAAAAHAEGLFGVTAEGARAIDYRWVFDGLAAPADVIVGDQPLQPPRELTQHPSLLDDADRAWLASRPGVRLHVAANAGHNIAFQAAKLLSDLLNAAVREAGGPFTPTQRAVLAHTPSTAARVRYIGGAGQAAAATLTARNPKAELVDDTPEVVAADDLEAALGAAAALSAGGVLVAGLPARSEGPDARLAALAAQGFEVLQLQPAVGAASGGYFDDAAWDLAPLWRAGALGGGAAAQPLVVVARRGSGRPPMHLVLATFAPTLMDIRTRLPAEALRREADLVVAHRRAPFALPALPLDTPKVQVLQRPAPATPERWRRAKAEAARTGWIVVLEYDDHPELVAEVTGRPVDAASWTRFRLVHGVQTSTPALQAAFAPYNPEVRVFPNAAFELAPFPQAATRRVFYGAVSRGAFAAEAARALAPAIAAFPDAAFEVVGDQAVFEALPTRNKRFHPYMPYEDYLALMGTCSISLSPIEGRARQETKSDAKFLDGAARGLLTIASPTIYADVIRHGENGLIAPSMADWGPLLAQALGDAAGQRQMARAAWDEVRARRMFADQIADRQAWYRDLWARRAELNAAVAKRLED